jgi:hypothetical protein
MLVDGTKRAARPNDEEKVRAEGEEVGKEISRERASFFSLSFGGNCTNRESHRKIYMISNL